jgi:hypothetical protein
MILRMNGTVCRCLAGSALCGLIVLTAVPATAQWLLPPWGATRADIRQSLEAQGYVLIAPLQRRPYVFLADVSAGPAGYQRLVIDARSGEILQRFVPPPRRWGSQLAERGGLLAGPPPYGFVEPGGSGGFLTMPNGGPAARSAYGGPADVRIPATISPVGPPDSLPATKPKPKSSKPQGAGANSGAATPAATVPLPPPKPPENQDSDKQKTNSPPTEVESAPPTAPEGAEDASKASPAAPPDLKPEAAPKAEPSATAQAEGPASELSAARRPEGPAPQPAARESSAEPSEKAKVSIVPATLFE